MAQALIDLLRETHSDAVASTHTETGDEVVTVPRERLVEVCRFLKDDPRADLKLLAQIACVDLLTYRTEATGGGALASIEVPAYDLAHKQPVEPRFRVAYNLGSVTKKHRLRLRVELSSDDVKAPTVSGIWRTADWWERYSYEVFGVEFVGHR